MACVLNWVMTFHSHDSLIKFWDYYRCALYNAWLGVGKAIILSCSGINREWFLFGVHDFVIIDIYPCIGPN